MEGIEWKQAFEHNDNEDQEKTDENKQDAPITVVICNFIAISLSVSVNKHKPWIETTYHGIITENDDKVLLDPPLIALDKDAPLRYAGEGGCVVLHRLQNSSIQHSLHIYINSCYWQVFTL